METKLYIGLNAEKNITKELVNEFEGVGFIRGEYLCRYINEYITLASCQKYIESYLKDICKKFSKKEVWYRFTDLTSNEIAILKGADDIMIEKWHFIGTKGARRYIKYPEAFKKECHIVKIVHDEYKNFGVIIPYIKDIEEYIQIKTILKNSGYNGKIGIMLEIPSALYQIEDFIKEGVDAVIIGLNDLTSLMLGTYRESSYHNKLHPVILEIVNNVKKICEKNNICFSIAGYLKKDEIEFYKKQEIERIIVNYANLPEINSKYKNLPEIDLLAKIKEASKRMRNVIEEGSKK